MRCNGCPVCGLPWIAFVCMAYEKSKIRGISFAEAECTGRIIVDAYILIMTGRIALY